MKSLLLLFAFFQFCTPESAAAPTEPAAVKLFKLPSFNEQGFLVGRLVGSAARPISPTVIEIQGLNFAMFPGDGTTQPDTNLLAPFATLHLDDNKIKVNGDQGVRLIREDLEAQGKTWSYDHSEKRLLMETDVRVIFHAELKNLLK